MNLAPKTQEAILFLLRVESRPIDSGLDTLKEIDVWRMARVIDCFPQRVGG
ncbi:MAG: hypothetical protein ACPGLY_18905 [Rubripirellula sp.]